MDSAMYIARRSHTTAGLRSVFRKIRFVRIHVMVVWGMRKCADESSLGSRPPSALSLSESANGASDSSRIDLASLLFHASKIGSTSATGLKDVSTTLMTNSAEDMRGLISFPMASK
eukprot:scaffold5681_cov377-Prasinococcus_capsulatus_cf.AAC.4